MRKDQTDHQRADMDMRWRIELFGGLRAVRGHSVITRFQTQQTGALLAYLAYHSERSHPREELIELLWPEREPRAGRNSLSVALSWLRAQLEPAASEAGAVLVADRAAVCLNSAALTTDVAEFEAALESAARAPTTAARGALLAQAVALHGGPLLPSACDDWVLQERAWLSERYFQALAQLVVHLEREGDLERALQYAHGAVRADPLREEAHATVMRLYAAMGQPEAALRQFQEMERLFELQLGIVPDAATRALARQIERQVVLRPGTCAAGRYRQSAWCVQAGRSRGDRCGVRVGRHRSPDTRAEATRSEELSPEGQNRLMTILLVGPDLRRAMPDEHDAGQGERAPARRGGGGRQLDPPRPGPPCSPAEEHSPARPASARLLPLIVDLVLKYEGRIDRDFGDGVLAVFGAVQVHEDDPERALRAALEIRAAAQQRGLVIKAGIDTGEACVSAGDARTHHEGTVAGPPVNRAFRLWEQAWPGQILASEEAYRQTRRAFEFSPWGLNSSDNGAPGTAYAAERALQRAEKARGIEGLRAELIGRDEELAKLQATTARALEGEGQFVSLIAEAGLGKSHLVAELKRNSGFWIVDFGLPTKTDGPNVPESLTLSDQSKTQMPRGYPTSKILWLEGRCLELGMGTAYSLFLDLFRSYFVWTPEEDEGGRVRRIMASLDSLVDADLLSAERAGEIGALLAHLFSLRSGNNWDLLLKNAGPEQLKQHTFTAVRDLLGALARQQPVMLIAEDLHWADALSLELISFLMESLADLPLLLLCVYRPEPEHRSWHLGTIAARKCAGRCTEIRLQELTPAESGRMIASLLAAGDLPPSLLELIQGKAHGNPFFVEEVVRALIDSGLLHREADTWRLREANEALPVPGTVQAVIRTRVDRLGEALKRVLECASVIGRLFRRRLLERAVDSGQWLVVSSGSESLTSLTTDHCSLTTALWELEERQLIYEERTVPEEEYSFRHALTQESVYDSIPPRRRTALHHRVAEVIEALYRDSLEEYYEPLAFHYERAGSDTKAIEYLLKAGEKSLRAYLLEEAAGYFRRAVERLERARLCETRTDWQLRAVHGLGQSLQFAGNRGAADTYHRQALALGKQMDLPSQELGQLYWALGWPLWVQGRFAEIVQLAEEAIALLGQASESVEAALITDLLVLGRSGLGEGREAYRLHFRTATYLGHLPYVLELMPVYEHVAAAYLSLEKDVEAARRWYAMAAQKSEENRDAGGRYMVDYNVARYITRPSGDLSGATAQFQKSLAVAQQLGDVQEQGRIPFDMACAYLQSGELERAAEAAGEALAPMESLGNRFYVGMAYQTIGTARLGQQRLDKAAEAFDKADKIWRAEGRANPDDAFARAQIARARGQRREACEQLRKAAELVRADPPRLARALAALEGTWDDPPACRAFIIPLIEQHPAIASPSMPHWFLEPAEPDPDWPASPGSIQNPNAQRAPEIQNRSWVRQDPFGDSAFIVENYLEIHAPNGRGLEGINLSAPRLLHPVAGDFAVQAATAPASAEKPAIGGLLLWRDPKHYLRLERGTHGPRDICFHGCLDNQDRIFGRGRLPTDVVFLRLERRRERVRALCSADGESWFLVGEALFSADDAELPTASTQAGLHAIGSFDRLVYPGAYPEGTAIRFEAFDFWQ